MDDRELSVVVVSYNSQAVLGDCLDSVLESGDFHLVVVDNGSSDGSREAAAKRGAEVLALPLNVGFAQAANQGARMAGTPYVCFLNPDCIVDRALFERAYECLSSDKKSVAVPDFLHDDGAQVPGLQPGYTRTKLLSDVIENNWHWPSVLSYLKGRSGYHDRSWHWPLGTCVFIGREFFSELGGFSEKYFLYMEDVELGKAVHCAGGKVKSLEHSIQHRAQRGSDVCFGERLSRLNRARILYAREHYGMAFSFMLRCLALKGR